MKKVFKGLLSLFLLFSIVSCGENTLNWPNGKLGNIIPQIEGAKGEVMYQYADSLYIVLEDININQYLDYIEECKDKGFTIDSIEENNSFIAFNNSGCKIDVAYFSSNDMWITVEDAIPMSTFDWPKSEIAELLPIPNSNYGKIEWEAEYGFVIYVGNTTKEEYREYVNEVYDCGFSIDYDKGNDYFYAENVDGYRVSIKYEGFNTMFLRIDEPSDTSDDEYENNSDNNDNKPSEPENLVDGMRPEFKEAMDSYEEFFDEYCDFMKKYNSSSNPSSLLGEYLEFMSQYAETMSKLEKIENEDLNDIELLYYMEVLNRINQKLLEIN